MDPMVELSKTGLSMYPISRPLYIYTLGKPEKHVQNYINWIMSKNGQHIVKAAGYVPIGTLE
jgi:ABC-type phosphate transport system substrate-binding protein